MKNRPCQEDLRDAPPTSGAAAADAARRAGRAAERAEPAPRRLRQPGAERDYVIQFVVPEFTCLCPLTGQPDFAHFTIEMVADRLCVELKSLKMYFWSYRNEGAFHEKVTNDIVDDLVRADRPALRAHHREWYVRGGIYTNVVAEHRQKGWKPQVADRAAAAGADPDLARHSGGVALSRPILASGRLRDTRPLHGLAIIRR